MDYQVIFGQLERIGREHINNWLSRPKALSIDANAYDAFKNFIGYGFYRNRTDELAEMYINHAKTALDEISNQSKYHKDRVRLLVGRGNELSEKFKQIVASESKKIHGTDLLFLKSACDDFIPKLANDDYNVKNFCVRFLKVLDLKNLYCHLDHVKGIGPKIAKLYLRDMLMLYVNSLNQGEKFLHKINSDQVKLVYPIDTWVEKISGQILGVKGDKEKIAEIIINKCMNLGVSPIYVNHGIYYIGARSQEFLLDNLYHIREFKVKTP